MKVPSLAEARQLLAEAEKLNPGPWVQHSIYVAESAANIAAHHPELDRDTAYILGYLHDIGRREGITGNRHIIDGYHFFMERDYPDMARICLTHSFPVLAVESAAGVWDCTAEELAVVRDYLAEIELDTYDYLIQLCDALALPSGFTIVEKRFVDVVLRHGFNEYTLARWRAYLAIKEQFEAVIGQSIYQLLPGIEENTFQ